jgi:ribonuclease R
VSRVDLDGRRIDFRLVQEGEVLQTRPAKDKDFSRGVVERVPFEAESAGFSVGRRTRKIAEPLARAPKSKAPKSKTLKPPTATKNNDKARKPRHRS